MAGSCGHERIELTSAVTMVCHQAISPFPCTRHVDRYKVSRRHVVWMMYVHERMIGTNKGWFIRRFSDEEEFEKNWWACNGQSTLTDFLNFNWYVCWALGITRCLNDARKKLMSLILDQQQIGRQAFPKGDLPCPISLFCSFKSLQFWNVAVPLARVGCLEIFAQCYFHFVLQSSERALKDGRLCLVFYYYSCFALICTISS